MVKISTEATVMLILAAVVVSMISLAYAFLSPPSVKRKRFVASMWLSLPASSLMGFWLFDSLAAVAGWVVLGIAITAYNLANILICPKCGTFTSIRTSKESFQGGKCGSCGFQIKQKAS